MKNKLLIGLLFVALTACAFANDAKAADAGKTASEPTVDIPKRTDAQKLAVRNAQVDFLQAKNDKGAADTAEKVADANLSTTQDHLSSVVKDVFSDLTQEGQFFIYKGKKYTINKDLDFVFIADVKQPDPPKASEAKK